MFKKALIKHYFSLSVFFCAGLISSNVFAMGSPKPEANDKIWYVPNIEVKKQERPNWCWAALTQALLSASPQSSRTPSQCEVASKAVKKDCCYSNKADRECLAPFDMETAFSANNISYRGQRAVVYGDWKNPDYRVFHQVANYVKKGKPVAIIIHNPTRRAVDVAASPADIQHVILAYGAYEKSDGKTYLLAWDPLGRIHRLEERDMSGHMKWQYLYFIK